MHDYRLLYDYSDIVIMIADYIYTRSEIVDQIVVLLSGQGLHSFQLLYHIPHMFWWKSKKGFSELPADNPLIPRSAT